MKASEVGKRSALPPSSVTGYFSTVVTKHGSHIKNLIKYSIGFEAHNSRGLVRDHHGGGITASQPGRQAGTALEQ